MVEKICLQIIRDICVDVRENKSFSGMDFNWIKEENRFGVCV